MAEHLTALREQQILDYVLGLGSEEARAKTAAHVAGCTEGCKELVAKHERLAEAIDEAPWESGVVPPELAARKAEIFSEIERQRAASNAVRKVERARATQPGPVVADETKAAAGVTAVEAKAPAAVIPIERARWRRTRVLAISGWGSAVVAAAGWIVAAVHGAQLVGPIPAVAQNPPAVHSGSGGGGTEAPRAMASVGLSAMDELSREQSRAAFDLEQTLRDRLELERDDLIKRLEQAGIPQDQAGAVADEILKMAARDAKVKRPR